MRESAREVRIRLSLARRLVVVVVVVGGSWARRRRSVRASFSLSWLDPHFVPAKTCAVVVLGSADPQWPSFFTTSLSCTYFRVWANVSGVPNVTRWTIGSKYTSILDVIHTHAFTVHVYSEEVPFTLKRCQKWALMYIVRYAVYIRVIFNVTPCIAYHFSRCIFYISWTCVCTTVLSLFLIWESHLLPITYTHIFTRITCVCIDMFVQCNVHVY